MAEWKKIIVSGSTAELTHITASDAEGGFKGIGRDLTGLTAASGLAVIAAVSSDTTCPATNPPVFISEPVPPASS